MIDLMFFVFALNVHASDLFATLNKKLYHLCI